MLFRSGHKVDSLKACDKICFTVYGNETVKEKEWAPYMQSVVIFGRCHLIENDETAMELLKQFAMKYGLFCCKSFVNHFIYFVFD